WREHMATLDRHEPFYDFVYSSRRADGSLDFVSISGKPVFDAGGQFAGYRGVAHDITKRKRAEADLRRSEAYLAEAQKLSRTGSWAYNRTRGRSHTGPMKPIACWASILRRASRLSKPFSSAFIRRIEPRLVNCWRARSMKGRTTNWITELFFP